MRFMKRFKLVVAYDGTNYCGWQIQPNGITVEEVLNKTLSRFLKEEIHIIGASRTDSGVHSFGNVAVFDSNNDSARKTLFCIKSTATRRHPNCIIRASTR